MGISKTQNIPMIRVLSLRNFRLLFLGAATSLLGDQFALIATPWLVLQLTGDPLTLGIVLALESIPRAAFMLLGGAITDRISPRIVMLISDTARLVLTIFMAWVVFAGMVQMWMLYFFALGFGLVAGFAVPAENSIVPMLVQAEDLQAGNSVMMGVGQLVGFIGPTMAGILIGSFSVSSLGIGFAFALDAVSFSVSAVCLWWIQMRKREGNGAEAESIWASIVAGLKYLWKDKVLRVMFTAITALNFLIIGPIMVGIPVLADTRLPEGAVAFGLLMSAYAGGNLFGYLVAGSLPKLGASAMQVFLIILLFAFGLVIGALGFIPYTWLDFFLLLALGMGNGYIAIILFTWMQTRTPTAMLGRMMSILMFSNIGLMPVSQALSGVLSKVSLEVLFGLAGGLVLWIAFWTARQPELKMFAESLTERPEVAEGG
jgi:MFS family permease